MLTKSPSHQIAKLKLTWAVPAIFLCVFMTSCLKEYVDISERSEVSSNGFAAAFPEDYKVGKSYKVRSNTSIKVNLEKENDYMLRLFPAEGFEGVEVKLLDSEGNQLVRNFTTANKYFRGFTFQSNKTAEYELQIRLPQDKKEITLAMASRKSAPATVVEVESDEQGFRKIKTYEIKKNTEEFPMVLAEGTMFRFEVRSEEEIKIIGENEKVYSDYTPSLDLEHKAIWLMGQQPTQVYRMVVEKQGTQTAFIDVKFKTRKQQEEENAAAESKNE